MTARPTEMNFGFWGKKKTRMAKGKKHSHLVLKPPKVYDIQRRSSGNHVHCLFSNPLEIAAVSLDP